MGGWCPALLHPSDRRTQKHTSGFNEEVKPENGQQTTGWVCYQDLTKEERTAQPRVTDWLVPSSLVEATWKTVSYGEKRFIVKYN